MPDAPTPSDPAVPVHPPPPPFLQRRLTVRGILDVLVFLAALSTLAGYLGAFWWPLENLGSFRIQYFWLLLFAGTAYAFARRPKPAIALGLLALVNAFSFVPLYLGGDRASGEPELRVLYANLLATNLDFHEFFELVRTEQPDIIVVVEVSTAWGNHLEALKRDYPYHHVDPLRGYFGIGLFSRLPLLEAHSERFGAADLPSVIARLQVDGAPLTIYGVHPPPPIAPSYVTERNTQLVKMADALRATLGPVLVIGDFNATSDSHVFRAFVRTTGLRDSRHGFGPQPSWWLFTPLLAIPIDHCLVSEEIQVHDRRLGPSISSDHRPLIVDVSVD